MIKFIDPEFWLDRNDQAYLDHTLEDLGFLEGTDYQRIHISNIKKDDKYYFLYRVQGYPSHDLFNGLPLPNEILNPIHNGYDIRIILTTFHESDDRNSLADIQKYCIENNIDERQIYIINGNSALKELQEEFNTNFNVYSNTYIPMTMSRQMDLDGNHPFQEDRMYKFQCYNRNFKNHRLGILAFLVHSNIIQETDWSNLYGSRLKDMYIEEENRFEYFEPAEINRDNSSVFNKEDVDKYNPALYWLMKQGDKKPDNETFSFDENGPQHDLSYKNNIYKDAYFNIVTETQFYWDNVIHITEKTTQPLWFFQIPIMVATPFHVKKTKELFDLDFFDDYVDHSYDNETNHVKRMKMICNEIERLSKIDKEDVRKYFREKHTLKRLYENRNKIRLIQFSDNDLNFYKQLPK